MKLDTQTFVERARRVHGDKYDYSKTVYRRSTEKVEIVCPIHGMFFQRPENHVNQKQHCPQCANKRKGRQDHFSFEWLLQRPERAYTPALLYVAEVQGKRGSYLEIGVSTRSLRNHRPQLGRTVFYLQYMSLKQALLLEQEIQKTFKEYSLDSMNVSSGKTICFQNEQHIRAALEKMLQKNEGPHK